MRKIFTLTIDLGNAAMTSHADVADALRRIADRIDPLPPIRERIGDAQDWPSGRVHDLNGNKVGEWKYTTGGES